MGAGRLMPPLLLPLLLLGGAGGLSTEGGALEEGALGESGRGRAEERNDRRLIWPSKAIDRVNRSEHPWTAGGMTMDPEALGVDVARRDATLGPPDAMRGNSSARRGLQTCPPGTEDLMGTGESCISCAPGRYDDDNDPNTFCNACGAGQVAEGGTTFCVQCPSGTYAAPGTYNGQSMIPGAAGYLEAGTGCFQCLNGKYSDDVAGGCDICESGWFDHDSNPSTPCVICHVGSYTVEGVTECEDCVPGRYDHDKKTNTPCVACAIGTFANFTVYGTSRKAELQRQADAGDNSAEKWLAGMQPAQCAISDDNDGAVQNAVCFQAEMEHQLLQQTSCQECEPGQHDHDEDPATPCEYCEPGKVSWSGVPVADEEYGEIAETEAWVGRGSWKSDHCEKCTAGMYAKYTDSSCTDCLGGSYTPEDGMPYCEICEKGTMSEDKASSCLICDRGTFAAQRNQSFCALCAVGQYGNGTKADKCVQCPDGTGHTMEGGTRLRSCCKPGTWADSDQGHNTCYDCANPEMCVGNGECDVGREGSWCATCMDGWFAMGGKCQECPDNSTPMVVAALAMFIALSFSVVNIATTKTGGGKAQSSSIVKEVGATPMSIMVTRLQVSLPVFKLGMEWPPWLSGWFGGMKGMISLDVSAMTAPECFTKGDPAAMYLSRSVTKLFLFPMLCVQMTIVFVIMQKCIWQPRGLHVRKTNVINCWVAAYSFLFVMLATSGFEPFDCAQVEGVYLLNAQREILCYEGQWIFIAFIGIVILLIYAIMVPTVLFRALLKMRISHFGDNLLRTEKNIELKARFGWIYERYRPAAWYYEFVMIFQRISSIGIAQVFGAQGTSIEGWAAFFILTCIVLRIQSRTKPYPEIVVDTETLFNGPNIPKPIKKILKTTPRHLSWNNMEQLGIAAQMISLSVGLYFFLSGDKESALALIFGLVTVCAFMIFIGSNLTAIALRVWALTRPDNKYYEERTRTPLHDYAEEDLLSKVFDEMSKGVDINHLDEENETPLYVATKNGNLRIIRALINGGADPNLGCGSGRWCTLHVATNVDTVKLLFIGGADATLQDAWGKTAEDVHLEEAEIPPVPKKGQRQTQADRDRYRRERLKMADMIADKSGERVCDWAWKRLCPSRRTRKITPYGKIMKDKPKRPGMGKMGGSKEEIMRFFYKKYGSDVQVKQVDSVLRTVLVGESEEQNYDLFVLYCTKIEQTTGKNPRDVWRMRTDAEKEECEKRATLNLDGYGGSGQGKSCAKSYKASDYRVQRGLTVDDEEAVFTGGKLPWHKDAEESSVSSGYSDYISDSEDEECSIPGQTVDVHLKLAEMKIKAREKAKAKKEAERLKRARKVKKSGLLGSVKGANTSKQESKLRVTGEIDANGNVIPPSHKDGHENELAVERHKSGGRPTGVSFAPMRTESLLEKMARNQEDWIQNALKRHETGSVKHKASSRTKSVKILDKKSFRKAKSYKVHDAGSAPDAAGRSPGPVRSFRNHNRAMSLMGGNQGKKR